MFINIIMPALNEDKNIASAVQNTIKFLDSFNIRIAKRGYLFAEVPYRLGLRKSGVSKALTFPSLLQVIKGYFWLVRDYYFRRKNKTKVFNLDSVSAKRYTR